MEPFYIVKTAEPEHLTDLRAWFSGCRAEAAKEGATFFRFSVDDENAPTVALVEGWREQPDDQGEPRFFMNYEL